MACLRLCPRHGQRTSRLEIRECDRYVSLQRGFVPFLRSTQLSRRSTLICSPISFAAPEDYFGLYWGTMDGFNKLGLFRDSTLITSYSPPNTQANSFVNFTSDNSGEFFNRVVLATSQCCFEVDNLAARSAASVPEPSTFVLLAASLILSGICTIFRGAPLVT